MTNCDAVKHTDWIRPTWLQIDNVRVVIFSMVLGYESVNYVGLWDGIVMFRAGQLGAVGIALRMQLSRRALGGGIGMANHQTLSIVFTLLLTGYTISLCDRS